MTESELKRDAAEQDVIYVLRHYFPDGARASQVIDKCCELTGKRRYVGRNKVEGAYALGLRFARLRLVESGVMKPHPFGHNRAKSHWELA